MAVSCSSCVSSRGGLPTGVPVTPWSQAEPEAVARGSTPVALGIAASTKGDTMTDLNGRRVAILAADGVERVELERPRKVLMEAGADTTLLSLEEGEIAARDNDLDEAGTFDVDRVVKDASVDEFDALLLPGG